MLDHLGKPAVADLPGFEVWHAGIRSLAGLPHVSVKLSGLPPEAPRGMDAGAYGPWLRAVVDAFGVERCMIGSDWPVSRLDGLSRSDWFAIVRDALALDDGEWARVSSGTAESIYRLSTVPTA